jgi:hypothetical protein
MIMMMMRKNCKQITLDKFYGSVKYLKTHHISDWISAFFCVLFTNKNERQFDLWWNMLFWTFSHWPRFLPSFNFSILCLVYKIVWSHIHRHSSTIGRTKKKSSINQTYKNYEPCCFFFLLSLVCLIANSKSHIVLFEFKRVKMEHDTNT